MILHTLEKILTDDIYSAKLSDMIYAIPYIDGSFALNFPAMLVSMPYWVTNDSPYKQFSCVDFALHHMGDGYYKNDYALSAANYLVDIINGDIKMIDGIYLDEYKDIE